MFHESLTQGISLLVLFLALVGCSSTPDYVKPIWEVHDAEQRSRVTFSIEQADEQFGLGQFPVALRRYLEAIAMMTKERSSGPRPRRGLEEEHKHCVERAVICCVVTGDDETLGELDTSSASPTVTALRAMIDVRAQFDATPIRESHARLWAGYETCKGSELESIYAERAGAMLGAGLVADARPREAVDFYSMQKVDPVPSRAARLAEAPRRWLTAEEQFAREEFDEALGAFESLAAVLQEVAPDSAGARHCVERAAGIRDRLELAASQPTARFRQIPAADDVTDFVVRVALDNWSAENARRHRLTPDRYDAIGRTDGADQVWLCRCDYEGMTVYRAPSVAFAAGVSQVDVSLPAAASGPFPCRVQIFLGPGDAPALSGELSISIPIPAARAGADPAAVEQLGVAAREGDRLGALLETTADPASRAELADKWAQALATWIEAARRAYTARFQTHRRVELRAALAERLAALPFGVIDVSPESTTLKTMATLTLDHGLLDDTAAFLASIEDAARQTGREPRNDHKASLLMKSVGNAYLDLAASYAADRLDPDAGRRILDRFRALVEDDRQFERRAQSLEREFQFAQQVRAFFPPAAFD